MHFFYFILHVTYSWTSQVYLLVLVLFFSSISLSFLLILYSVVHFCVRGRRKKSSGEQNKGPLGKNKLSSARRVEQDDDKEGVEKEEAEGEERNK